MVPNHLSCQCLLASSSKLSLSIFHLLLCPGLVSYDLLLVSLSSWVIGLASSIDRSSIPIGPSLPGTLVTTGQHTALTISSKSSKWANSFPRRTNQAATNVNAVSIHINQL